MSPQSAKEDFARYLEEHGKHLDSLSVSDALNLMVGFYVDDPAIGCATDQDGDMLLFQWGTYDWGEGKWFEFNLTRQLIEGEGEDEDIKQLSLTFRFTPTEPLQSLGQGNRWCSNLEEVGDFRGFIMKSQAYSAVTELQPKRIILDYEIAG